LLIILLEISRIIHDIDIDPLTYNISNYTLIIPNKNNKNINISNFKTNSSTMINYIYSFWDKSE